MGITIITDSLNDLTEELLKVVDCKIIPLNVIFPGDDKIYLDGVDITADEIYERVEKSKTLPHTAAITPSIFIQYFKEELDKGNQVFYTGTGSGISSTFQNAVIAKEELDPENKLIALTDSKTLSTGIGLLLLKARKAINEGNDLFKVKEIVDSYVDKLSVKFCIDILDYLYKGGRCGALSYLFGKVLHIHPLIKVEDNKLKVAEKPRGKYEKAMDLQIEEFKKDLKYIDMDYLFITHSGPKDCKDYQYIYDRIKDYIPEGHLFVTRAKATVSCHCGPRTIGILYIKNK